MYELRVRTVCKTDDYSTSVIVGVVDRSVPEALLGSEQPKDGSTRHAHGDAISVTFLEPVECSAGIAHEVGVDIILNDDVLYSSQPIDGKGPTPTAELVRIVCLEHDLRVVLPSKVAADMTVPGTRTTVKIYGVQDLAGNRWAVGAKKEWSFTTTFIESGATDVASDVAEVVLPKVNSMIAEVKAMLASQAEVQSSATAVQEEASTKSTVNIAVAAAPWLGLVIMYFVFRNRHNTGAAQLQTCFAVWKRREIRARRAPRVMRRLQKV